MNEAEKLSRSVHEWATKSGCHIVPVPLATSDTLAMPSAALSPDEFIVFIHAAQPPLIYLFEGRFDVDQEVEVALDEASLESYAKGARAVRKAAERLRSHQGEIGRVVAEAVVGGVHHMVYAAASWVIAFEQGVEATAARAAEESAERNRQARVAADAHARSLAKCLLADPAFNSGRVSFAKRRFLAAELFPGEEDGLLDVVVELAENMHWLTNARQ